MSVAATSISAYHDHRDSGALGKQCRQLLGSMRWTIEYTRSELAIASGLRLSSVCGRVNELMDAGYLVEGPVRPCRVTGKRVSTVRLPPGQGVLL